VRCSSHQVNLAITSAVTGRAAVTAHSARQSASAPDESNPHRNVCGTIVRLFKYLVNDYYANFCSNLADLTRSFALLEPTTGREVARGKWEGLAELYGDSVLPPELLRLFNAGLGEWGHAASVTGQPLCAMQDDLLHFLRKKLLVVDEKPTLTRMFTFNEHINTLLLMSFLGLTHKIVKPRGGKPQERNQRRMRQVNAFMADPATPQYLRCTALALDILGHAHGVCGQMGQEVPLLVRLARGQVQDNISADLTRICRRMHLDKNLAAAECFTLLLGVCVELSVRFRQYEGFPYRAHTLSKKFNAGYIPACVDFLQTPSQQLDTGFSLPLKKLAERGRETEVERLKFLLSAPVQEALDLAFSSSEASSLPVERKHAVTKRNEAPRLCHVSTAGRNQIIRAEHRERERLLSIAEAASAEFRKAAKLRITSLAWERCPSHVGRSIGVDARPKEHDAAELARFVHSHRDELQHELKRRRQGAKDAVESARVARPLTQREWVEWFEDNSDSFARRMVVAGATRRESNRRMHADSSIVDSVERLEPRSTSCAASLPAWQRFLTGRSGWFCAASPAGPVRSFFFAHQLHGQCWCYSIEAWRC